MHFNMSGPVKAEAARIGWGLVLSRVIDGFPAELTERKGQPCPECGGENRFFAHKGFEETGACGCRGCFEKGGGDGIEAVKHFRGVGFPEALKLVADACGVHANSPLPKPSSKPTKANKTPRRFTSHTEAVESARSGVNRSNGVDARETLYEYRSGDDELVFCVARFDFTDPKTGKPTKTFRPISHDGEGWVLKAPKGKRPLYNLSEVQDQGTVFVVEGEKAAEAGARLGVPTTTSSGGTNAFDKTDWSPLAGREVAILADNDEAGKGYQRKVGSILSNLQPPAVVKHVELPGLPEKGDLYEFVEKHGIGHKTTAMLFELVDKAEPNAAGSEDLSECRFESLLTDIGRTDQGSAKRFAEANRHRARFVGEWQKWIVFDGKQWQLDQTSQVNALAQEENLKAYHWLGQQLLGGGDQALKASKYVSRQMNRPKLVNTVELAVTSCGLKHEEIDKQPMLLNCNNGTIDLATGTLHEHDPKHLLMHCAPVEYDRKARCPEFERFLASCFDDPEIPAFLQRLLGYAITGDVREHVMAVFYGKGRNGKGTLWRAIESTLSDSLTCNPRPNLIMNSRRDEHPTESSVLFRKRLACCQETKENCKLDEATVKSLTGGDRIQTRRMREDNWEFDPTHQLILATNHKPTIEGHDKGIWSRILLIPFTKTFEGEACDKQLDQKLAAERPGILNWLVEGCLMWQREGLRPPSSVTAATDAYKSEQDAIGGFLQDCCSFDEDDPDAWSRSSELYDAFRWWCNDAGCKTPYKNVFLEKLAAHPKAANRIEFKRKKVGRGYQGIYVSRAVANAVSDWIVQTGKPR